MATQAGKAAAPGVGNAIAYFLVLYVATKGWVGDDDKMEAVAFAGAIVTYVLLQLGVAFGAIGRAVQSVWGLARDRLTR